MTEVKEDMTVLSTRWLPFMMGHAKLKYCLVDLVMHCTWADVIDGE